MNAGKLDRKIKLQTPTVSRDAWGGATTTYADMATVWAKVDFSLGESFQRLYFNETERINIKDSAVFTIRYRTDIDTETRIVFKNEDWRIEGIREDNSRDAYLHIMAAKIRKH